MEELRTPHALKAGDVVLIYWPDWIMRRAVVVSKRHFGTIEGHHGKKVVDPELEVWRIVVRFVDGDDTLLEQPIYRGNNELIPTVVKPNPRATRQPPPV